MQSLYIAGAGSGSGKSAVVLGFMEMLSAVNRKVGFFRPIVRQSVEQDDLTNLIRSRYNLPFPPEMLYGCTSDTAAELVACGRYDDLLKLILDKFKTLEERCDLVVCSGTDYDGARALAGVRLQCGPGQQLRVPDRGGGEGLPPQPGRDAGRGADGSRVPGRPRRRPAGDGGQPGRRREPGVPARPRPGQSYRRPRRSMSYPSRPLWGCPRWGRCASNSVPPACAGRGTPRIRS